MSVISFRTKVFNRATQIRLETGKSHDVSLMISWKVYGLIQRMKKGEVKFAYEKKGDGTLRYAIGTLKNIPDGVIRNGQFRDRDWHRHYKTVPYWDVEAKEFRSFKPHLYIRTYDEDQPHSKASGINIEISGYESDGSLTTATFIAKLLEQNGIKVNINVPQKDVNADFEEANQRSLKKISSLLKETKMNLTYVRKRKYTKKQKT